MRIPEKENNQCKAPERVACLECLTNRKKVCPVQNDDKSVRAMRQKGYTGQSQVWPYRSNTLIFNSEKWGTTRGF